MSKKERAKILQKKLEAKAKSVKKKKYLKKLRSKENEANN
jgi:hypothetical protein